MCIGRYYHCLVLSAIHTFSCFDDFFQTAPPHVRVPEGTDSDCVECTFLPATRTHWSCRDFSEHSGSCTQALSQGCSRKRMSDFFDL